MGFSGSGVKITGVYQDHKTEMKKVYDPSHPDADEDGYVLYPNVNIITEMTNIFNWFSDSITGSASGSTLLPSSL